ncbi:MAG: ABC transporter permease [Spirochaetia bacterium]
MIGNAVQLAVPLILAGLGGLLTERAGVLNIGLEGMILIGAFGGILGANATGSLLVGFLVGAGFGLALGVIFSLACIELRANIFIAGLATNLLAVGTVPYMSELVYGTKGVVRLNDARQLPELLGVGVTLHLALLAALIVWVLIYHTPFGLRLRAAGNNPPALEARGVPPSRYQRAAMLLSGLLAGAAGAEIAIRLGVYLPNLSAGRGWIALVAVFLGYRRPLGVVIAAVVFAFFEVLAGSAQGFLEIPGTVLLGLPYLFTVIAMVVYSALRRRRV